MLTVEIWDCGCGCEIEVDGEGFIRVKDSGGNDVQEALGGSVSNYECGEEQDLAEEVLSDWSETYEGDPSTNGLRVTVLRDGIEKGRADA